MLDKNGTELTTGKIVKIENAYFKNDNGIYFVENAPGDPWYCGNDLTLKRLNKNGKMAKTNPIAFWPLCAFVSSRQKCAEAKAWNKKNATIEVIEDFNTEHVANYYLELHEMASERAKREKLYGYSEKDINHALEAAEFYKNMAENLS